jgi:orotate phosphoribosyltransferase
MEYFKKTESILHGHFRLSSGLHSDTYIQCAKVMIDPQIAQKVCQKLAEKINDKFGKDFFDYVVSPAMGGILVGYEVAKQIKANYIFCERVEGKFEFRRGFSLPKDAKVLIVEDVITTGKSSLEAIDCIKKNGGNAVAEASLINRSDAAIEIKLAIPLVYLLKVEAKIYDEHNLPESLKKIPIQTPGSRFKI